VQQTLVRNRIAFTYVEPPIAIARERGPRFLAAKAVLKALILPKGMTYVDFSENEFDSSNCEYFADPLHMSTKGRTVFSGLIAERISEGKL
jgi:lysophospholipase L1-like esterase